MANRETLLTNEELEALLEALLALPKAKRMARLKAVRDQWRAENRFVMTMTERLGEILLRTLPQKSPDQHYLPWRDKVRGE